jgi:hypothetical protein
MVTGSVELAAAASCFSSLKGSHSSSSSSRAYHPEPRIFDFAQGMKRRGIGSGNDDDALYLADSLRQDATHGLAHQLWPIARRYHGAH